MRYEIPDIDGRRKARWDRDCENYYPGINQQCSNTASVVIEYEDGNEVALCENCQYQRT